MKIILLTLSVLACACLLTAWARGFFAQSKAAPSRFDTLLTFAFHAPLGFLNAFSGRTLYLANVAEGTHVKSVSKLADAAHTAKHLLVKWGSDADHVALCGAADEPLGVTPDDPDAAEDAIEVRVLGASDETALMVASEAIAKDDHIYTAANGKVQDEPAVAGTYYRVGRAVAAASGDGELVEVEPCTPIKVVVIAALTSTNGVAAAASANLAALAAEAEKIGDDVRAIGAALATPALVKVLSA